MRSGSGALRCATRLLRARLSPACLLAVWLLPLAGATQPVYRADEVPLADLLEIVVLEREVLAIDAEGGGVSSERLHLNETVLWYEARGKVGLVTTDQRVLAASTGSSIWVELRFERGETRPQGAVLGDRVALLVTSHRAIGFTGASGGLIAYRIGPGEKLLATGIGENVAVVVTDRKALGLSAQAGGFFERSMHLRERLERVDARSNVATVTTDRRILVFRAPTASWGERRLELR